MVIYLNILKKILMCSLQVDFWQPNSASLIHQNQSVDVHVKHHDIRGIHERLTDQKISYQ